MLSTSSSGRMAAATSTAGQPLNSTCSVICWRSAATLRALAMIGGSGFSIYVPAGALLSWPLNSAYLVIWSSTTNTPS
ncbi:hypothetical protein D9M71_606830 [compost metagenome]